MMHLRLLLIWIVACMPGLEERACGGDVSPVKVMSFNIRYATAPDGDNHWNKRKDFLADTIRAFDPDLLGTQETLAVQRDYLVKRFPLYGMFAAGRDDGKEKGEMAALYWRKDRFDRVGGGHFWLSESPERAGSKGWDAALPRVATWVKLRDRELLGSKLVLFLNTHFDHLGTKARVESSRLLRQQIQKLGDGCSLVVTGDFNAGEDSTVYQALFGKLDDKDSPIIDTYRRAHPKRGKEEGTFNGFRPDAVTGGRIDWIGCSRDWMVSSATIDRITRDGRTPSDHFPVTAVLRR